MAFVQESILNGLPRIKPWEYGLGDKGYVGCPQIITEWKGDGLTRRQIEFNLTLQHYRGRVEHLISEMVQSRRALNTRWHGSFSLLAAVMKITAHMVGLQERMKASAVRCVSQRCETKTKMVFSGSTDSRDRQRLALGSPVNGWTKPALDPKRGSMP